MPEGAAKKRKMRKRGKVMQKGRILLRVTGILYILRAALFFLACFAGAVSLMTEEFLSELKNMGNAGILLFFFVILIIWAAAAFDLTVGILGVLRAAHPKRSVECLVMGVLTTAFEGLPLLPILVMFFLTAQRGAGIWGMLIWEVLNAVIAVCYLVAAVQVWRSAQQPAAGQWGDPMPPQI